jgi:outer membrane beta-barrel protein
MKKSLLLAVAGILVAATIASAANREGELSVSPIIGGYTYDDNQGRDSDANMLYGVRAGYNITKELGFEGLFEYVNSQSNSSSGGDINMYRYGGQLLYHFFPDKQFVPYLAVGFAGLNFDAKGLDGQVHGAFDYGVGLKYFVNDRFALRADFRHLIYDMNGTKNNVEYTLGAYIPLYVVKPAAKPVEPIPAPPAAPKPATEAPTQSTPARVMTETKETPSGKILVTGLNVDDNMIEIQATERIRDYKVFTLTEPSRLVIDIPNGVGGAKLENIRIDKLGIATARFENHPDYLRIFLDSTQWRILPYRIEESDKSLKIIITTP